MKYKHFKQALLFKVGSLFKFRKVQKFLGSSLIGVRLYSSLHIFKE